MCNTCVGLAPRQLAWHASSTIYYEALHQPGGLLLSSAWVLLCDTQKYIHALRIKELQEVLERLGMRKTGRKNDLQQRLMAVFNDSSAL